MLSAAPVFLSFSLALISSSVIAQDPTLTIERIFDSPDLSGPSLRQAELSPAGDRVTFIRAREDDRDLMDLWEYHIADGETRRLVAADAVLADEGELSDEEKARRERARISGLRGIVEYRWSPDGRFLIFPLGGNVFLLDLDDAEGAVRQITTDESFDTDPKIAPDGRHVAFVRDRNLWVAEVETTEARALTDDASDTVSNGMAEFIAQEEMGRSTGYWWSPDSR
ncbi:MAG: DPP IV N-terminal domain-containing protein, partial [Wenzhouxiangella sp.]|nr:DPP IV N-terminal domain-containing protein [Wenzhouxiangella sp.]